MIQIVVVTHGYLAREMVNTAELIVGEQKNFCAICLEPHEGIEDLNRKLTSVLSPPGAEGEGSLVFTDMFGGTPSNVSLAVSRRYSMQVITGVNLPMILEALTHRATETLDSLAVMVQDKGRKSILSANAAFADLGQGK